MKNKKEVDALVVINHECIHKVMDTLKEHKLSIEDCILVLLSLNTGLNKTLRDFMDKVKEENGL